MVVIAKSSLLRLYLYLLLALIEGLQYAWICRSMFGQARRYQLVA